MRDFRSIRHSTWFWAASLVFAFGFGLLLGYRLSSRNSAMASVTLRVTYHDQATNVAQTFVNGNQGSNVEFHQGSATYVFKNQLPFPMKLMFPPIGYSFSGSVPRTPQVNDVAHMPTFCQQQQVVQLEPFSERSFESPYTMTGNTPQEHFVFGCPRQEDIDDVFVGEVTSTSEIICSAQ